MTDRQASKKGNKVYHRDYCLYHDWKDIVYDAGAIRRVSLETSAKTDYTKVIVCYCDGEKCEWTTKWISSYNFQFGIAVSFDGKYVFVQTWENGLICLNAKTGEQIWKTKSRRGITNIFVNRDTILCHQRERALQLIDICSGEILAEKRPATAWGFTAIDYKCIVCRVTAKRWEMIDTETLAVRKTFSHSEFTGGHTDYVINRIVLTGEGALRVGGFQNVWDGLAIPLLRLPNREFEHLIELDKNE